MSASDDNRGRQTGRDAGAERRRKAAETAEQERKQGRRIAYGFLSIVLVLGVLTILVNTNILNHSLAAVTIDGDKYSATDFNFFYNTEYTRFANDMGDYLSYYIDTSKPLKSQECVFEPGTTWDDYFTNAAISSMKQVTMLSRMAKTANFTLPEEYYTEIDSIIESLNTYYAIYGYPNVKSFIAANYGKGATEKTLRAMLEKAYLSSAYAAELQSAYEYTPEQLAEWYDEHRNEYDIISYRIQSVYADMDGVPEVNVDPGLEPDPDEVAAHDEAVAERLAEARERAQAFLDAGSEDEFKALAFNSLDEEDQEYYADNDFTLVKVKGSSLYEDEGIADWLLELSRKPGETAIFEYDWGYDVAYFVEREGNDYELVNIRHILIKPESTELFPEQFLEEAKEKAEGILETWKAGDATEESFAELANELSEDTGSNTKGGLYEKVAKGQMVPEFNDFCFEPGRKPGDTGIVYGESSSYKGYHVMYYSGTAGVYRDLIAKSLLSSEDYSEWESAELEKMPEPVTGFAMRLTK